MEGAAFLYVCAMQGVPHAQVRAVSNMVERRNRAVECRECFRSAARSRNAPDVARP